MDDGARERARAGLEEQPQWEQLAHVLGDARSRLGDLLALLQQPVVPAQPSGADPGLVVTPPPVVRLAPPAPPVPAPATLVAPAAQAPLTPA